jgi:flagellar protein FliL
MATKEAPKKEADDAAPKKSKKKLFILIIAAVVVLAIAGGGAMMFLKKKGHEGDGGDEEAAAAEHEAPKFDPKKPPVFVPLEPFTVNLQPENGEQFLQVVATIRVTDEKTGEEVKVFMPQIRHEMLALLAGKRASEITSTEGREGLADEMKQAIDDVLGWEPPKRKKGKKKAEEEDSGPVIAVFFTQFIVQ